METVYQKIVSYMIDTYQFEGCTLFLVNPNKNTYKIEKFYLPPDLNKIVQEKYLNKDFPLDLNKGGETARCILNNKESYFQNFENSQLFEINQKLINEWKIITLLNIPVSVENDIIGVLSMTTHTRLIILNNEDIDSIKRFVNQIAIILKNSKVYDELNRTLKILNEKDRIISEDLNMAKRIQTKVISKDYKRISDISITVHFEPMIEVGGDIYDIFEIKPKYYRIFIADATGHGVQAALSTMIIKSEYDKIKSEKLPLNKILSIFNNKFIKNYGNLNVFFTCAIVDIDLNMQKIIYSSAGHPEQYLIKDNIIYNLKAGGKMIGVIENIEYELRNVEFNKHDKLLLFTDGLFEEFSDDLKELDEEGLLKIVEKYKFDSIEIIVPNVIRDVKKWMGKMGKNDDITLIGLKYN
jgi:serine phosphatase RsbU (regulator of sigma subunit)